MLTSILIGVGGGLLLELLGTLGTGRKAAAGGRSLAALVRLTGITRRLRDRMSDEERREADEAVSVAERIAFGRRRRNRRKGA
jgi:hypothetical protein